MAAASAAVRMVASTGCPWRATITGGRLWGTLIPDLPIMLEKSCREGEGFDERGTLNACSRCDCRCR